MRRRQKFKVRGEILAIILAFFVLFIIIMAIPKSSINTKNESNYNITITKEQLINNCSEVKEMLERLNVTSSRVICNISEGDEIIKFYKNTSYKK